MTFPGLTFKPAGFIFGIFDGLFDGLIDDFPPTIVTGGYYSWLSSSSNKLC